MQQIKQAKELLMLVSDFMVNHMLKICKGIYMECMECFNEDSYKKQVGILISKNQVLQILYLKHHVRYRSNATSHSWVPNSRVEHCYTWVNCNDLRVILCILACSIHCMYLVLEWSTRKLHKQSAYTRECPTQTCECPTHASDHTRYIYIKI